VAGIGGATSSAGGDGHAHAVDADIAPAQLVHRGKSKTLSNKQRRSYLFARQLDMSECPHTLNHHS
jgi:hypothetical protein